jgi:phage shock protein A
MFKLIKRIFNVLLGKTNRAVDELEKSDPDAVFTTAIEVAAKEVVEIREAAREAQGLVFAKNEEIAKLDEMLFERGKDLQLAIKQGNEAVGAKIIEDIESLKAKHAEATAELAELKNEAAMAEDALETAMKERADLEEKKKTAKQMEKTEKIISRIEDRKSGMADDAISTALENASDKINAVRAARASRKSVVAKSLDGEIDAMRAQEKADANKAAFAAMVAASKEESKPKSKKTA